MSISTKNMLASIGVAAVACGLPLSTAQAVPLGVGDVARTVVVWRKI